MAQKVNSEFNYRTQVKGDTVWARIQTLHGFLEGRKSAFKMKKVSALRFEAKKAKLSHLELTNGLAHEILNLRADILEYEALVETEQDGFNKCEEEIKMLEELLRELYEEAEPTRIAGFTDEQMFEVNAINDFTTFIAREIQCEIIATGRPSPARLRNAMSCPQTFEACQKLGLIPSDVFLLEGSVDPLKLEFKQVFLNGEKNEHSAIEFGVGKHDPSASGEATVRASLPLDSKVTRRSKKSVTAD